MEIKNPTPQSTHPLEKEQEQRPFEEKKWRNFQHQ
jgi:hypothetical protein